MRTPFFRLLGLLLVLAPAAQAADRVDAIAARGEVRAGFRTAAAPFSDLDAGGKPVGYTVALCEAVIEQLHETTGRHLRTAWVDVTAGDRFALLEEGAIDLLCEATSVTLERRDKVDFSLFTWSTGLVAAVRRDDGPASLEALATARAIGTVFGTTGQAGVLPWLASAKPKPMVIEAESHEAGLSLLAARQYDVYLGDREVLAARIAALGLGDRIALLPGQLSAQAYAIGLPKGAHRLRLAADRALAQLYRSGRIDAITERFIPGAVPAPVKALYALQALPD